MKVPARCVGHPQAWRPADWGAERGYRLPPSATAVKVQSPSCLTYELRRMLKDYNSVLTQHVGVLESRRYKM